MRREEPQADQPLLVDQLNERLARFRILYDRDDAATDQLLAELGGQGKVEREMLRELAATGVLRRPDRVPEAHAVAMHALEVLSRNGSRPPSSVRRLGPLTRVASYLVQQVIRYVVRRHQHQVVEALRDLYSRRIGWVPPGDPARSILLRSRLDVERSAPAYKKNTVGIPAFLLGGAVVSSLTRAVQNGVGAAAGSRVGISVAIATAFVLVAASSWVILQGAAVARRRIKLSLDRPLAALWETIGWCGRPPRDNSSLMAAIAIALTVVGWLLIPFGLLLEFALF
ncbi:MAG TPA: hypothetical protein VM388_13170 [Acidimicrobiales bacterium]|nr:hypothetical protein [Acidimicrobiales bacterium]HWI05153.1 hypothetical protein [Acidimicrobiales bacterium]